MNELYINSLDISIVIPCLNEGKAIVHCLNKLKSVIKQYNLKAEVIVVDNNSSDNTNEIVRIFLNNFPELKLIEQNRLGYGSALITGFEHSIGRYVYMADCDCTYDFSEIPNFIYKLDQGYDMVIGNRFSGGMEYGAMPFHKKYIGNPILSFITRTFFSIKIHDIHCGARAFKRKIYNKLSLHTIGMEFASEMIIKAAKQGLNITEIPVRYSKRVGESKLSTIKDGWRHLRFMLLYSPLILFLLPGSVLLFIGIVCMGVLYFSNPLIMGIKLFFHPMFLFSAMIISGYQLILFSMFAKIYAITHLGDVDENFRKLFRLFTVEKAGFIGLLFILVGSVIYLKILVGWIQNDFGSLGQIKNSISALTFTVLGVQTFFSAFMLSILGIKEK